MYKKEIKEWFCTNKEEVLKMLDRNHHFSPYMDEVIKIVEQLNLPDLEEIFNYEENKNEFLVYNLIDEQEVLFPITGLSIDKIYNFEQTETGCSHNTKYSIPIVVIPLENCSKTASEKYIMNIHNEDMDLVSLEWKGLYNE